jgi:hypothetical protein
MAKKDRIWTKEELPEIFKDVRWRDLFGDDKFLLIDGGAQGGLEKEWVSVKPLLRVVAVSGRS